MLLWFYNKGEKRQKSSRIKITTKQKTWGRHKETNYKAAFPLPCWDLQKTVLAKTMFWRLIVSIWLNITKSGPWLEIGTFQLGKRQPASPHTQPSRTQSEGLSFPKIYNDYRNYNSRDWRCAYWAGFWQWLWKEGRVTFKNNVENIMKVWLSTCWLFSWMKIMYLYFKNTALMVASLGNHCVSCKVLTWPSYFNLTQDVLQF